MSRVGKQPVRVPQGVKIEQQGLLLKVEGPKGKLQHCFPAGVSLVKGEQDWMIAVDSAVVGKKSAAMMGSSRSVVQNLVTGVSDGFVRELDIVGVGYRAAVKGNVLSLTVGYSHPVDFSLPTGVGARVDNNTHIVLNSSDKVLIGMVAAKIRSFREPEPYQGKGIRYTNEHIIRKEGKAAGAGGK